jgi:hypothetical protein
VKLRFSSLFVLTATIIVVCTMAFPAWACRTTGTLTLEQYDKAPLVIIGVVKAFEPKFSGEDRRGALVSFKVESVLQGTLTESAVDLSDGQVLKVGWNGLYSSSLDSLSEFEDVFGREFRVGMTTPEFKNQLCEEGFHCDLVYAGFTVDDIDRFPFIIDEICFGPFLEPTRRGIDSQNLEDFILAEFTDGRFGTSALTAQALMIHRKAEREFGAGVSREDVLRILTQLNTEN